MESSQMSKALSSIFQNAGIDGPMSHTLYRKSAVSECHQNRKDISGNLADLMANRRAPRKNAVGFFTRVDHPSRRHRYSTESCDRNVEKRSE